MDIIERAFEHEIPRNWDRLATWLKVHGHDVNGVPALVKASRRAQVDGHLVPSNPEAARTILRKYLEDRH